MAATLVVVLTTATVRWNGSNRQTTFVSSTQLTAIITAADIANAGTAQVTVRNQGSGGTDTSTSLHVSFTINNPVPFISSLSPASVLAGGPNFTLTVNGSNFVEDSRVRLDNSNENTTFVSSTQLTARIQDNDIRQPGTLSITVVNPGPGGGTSNAVTLNVTASLTITSGSTSTGGCGGFSLFSDAHCCRRHPSLQLVHRCWLASWGTGAFFHDWSYQREPFDVRHLQFYRSGL